MKTKYFRFLFCGDHSSMLHFGELTDTFTEERFTFLYLRGTQEAADQSENGRALFLCLKHVDLLVIGNANEQTDGALGELLSRVQADTIVFPESSYEWKTKFPDAAKKIGLSRNLEGTGSGNDKRNSIIMKAAGWKFFMKSYADGRVTMAHGLNDEGMHFGEKGMNSEVDQAAESTGMERCEGARTHGMQSGRRFEDCVMKVKVLDRNKRCCSEQKPDEFACALGCVCKQDYDECRAHGKEGNEAYLTGTLLCEDELSDASAGELEEDMGNWIEQMRFFGIPASSDGSVCQNAKNYFDRLVGEHKKYFLGMEKEIGAQTVSDICGSGLYQIPVLLKEEKGICCSGFLKYSEDK